MRIKKEIQNALDAGYTPDEVWKYLSTSHGEVVNALKHYSPEEVQKYIGLKLSPLGKVKSKAMSAVIKPAFGEPLVGTPMPQVTQPLPETPPPELSILPGGLTKDAYDYEKAIAQRQDIAALRDLPTGDLRLQAFVQGYLPIAPKKQLPPLLEKAYPISYYGGKLAGLATSFALTGGIKEAVKESPSWWLQAQRFGSKTFGYNINQTLNIMADAARSAAAFGSKELVDQLSRVFAGEKPTVGKLVGEPLGQAAFGVLMGGTAGIEETPKRIIATGGASAAYDSLMKLAKKGHIGKDDLQDIVLMSGVRMAVRSIGSRKLTEYYRQARMEDHLHKRLVTKLGKLPGKYAKKLPWAEAEKRAIEVEQLPREIDKLYQQALQHLGRPSYEMIIEQKFPGFEGMPKNIQEKMIGRVIQEVGKGTAIDKAIDVAAEASKPITEQGLMFLQSLAGGIPTEMLERLPVTPTEKPQPLEKLSPEETLSVYLTGGLPGKEPVSFEKIKEIVDKEKISPKEEAKIIKSEKVAKPQLEKYYNMLITRAWEVGIERDEKGILTGPDTEQAQELIGRLNAIENKLFRKEEPKAVAKPPAEKPLEEIKPIAPTPEIKPTPPTELERIIGKPEPKIAPKIEKKEEAEAKPLVEPEKAKKEIPSAKLPIKISPKDIEYQLAYNAHRGTSFTPEKRATQEQQGYIEHMENFYKEMEPLANTEEKKAILVDEIERYRQEYLKRYKALLVARSRTLSPMITGPSKFPTSKNRKALATEDRRRGEFLDWEKKARSAIRRKLTGSEAIKTEDPEAVVKLKKKLENAQKLQETMVAANKIVRKKGLSDAEKINGLVKIEGISEKTAKGLLEPDFAGRLGFPDYRLQNNNAEIRRLKTRIGEVSRKQAQETKEIQFEGGHIVDNVDENRLQIFFDGKPDAEIRAKLKKSGFRWAPSIGAWQRHRSSTANYYAEQITGVKVEKAVIQPTIKPEQVPQQPPKPKIKASSAKLRDLADKMQSQIDSKKDSAIGAQRPTARRARIAASMYKEGERMEAIQNKLRAMADAIDEGTLPDSLAGITNKAQLADLLIAIKHNRKFSQLYDRNRIVKAGIKNDEELEQAKKDLSTLGGEVKPFVTPKERKIKEIERELLGYKIPGFFSTPKPLAEKMVNLANISKGARVLEPSAGKGNIADAIKGKDISPDVIEWNLKLQEILKLKDYNLVGEDFTKFKPDKPYDAIIMNPPFEKGQDIDHVKHAYIMLKPGGRLVSIMSEGPFFRSDKKATEFREWLAEVGGSSEKLPQSTFKEAGTGVNARLVTITKPAVQPTAKPIEKPETELEKIVKPKAKEPWEITKEEFYKDKFNIGDIVSMPGYKEVGKLSWVSGDQGRFKDNVPLGGTWNLRTNKAKLVKRGDFGKEMIEKYGKHKKFVQQALSEGKHVPSEVLADYPDLQVKPKGELEKIISPKEEAPREVEKPKGELAKIVEKEVGETTLTPISKAFLEQVKIGSGKAEGFTEVQKEIFVGKLLEERTKLLKEREEDLPSKITKPVPYLSFSEANALVKFIDRNYNKRDEQIVLKNIDKFKKLGLVTGDKRENYNITELGQIAAIVNSETQISRVGTIGSVGEKDMIYIKIPGDGKFKIFNNLQAINEVLRRLNVKSAATPIKPQTLESLLKPTEKQEKIAEPMKEFEKPVKSEQQTELEKIIKLPGREQIAKRIKEQEKKGKELEKILGFKRIKPKPKKGRPETGREWLYQQRPTPAEEKPKEKLTEKPPVQPQGTSSKTQRKIAHILAKQADMAEKEYRDLAEKVTGYRSITQMSEEEAHGFIHKIDEVIRKNEDMALKSMLVSSKQKRDILQKQIDRTRQIGKTVTSEKYEKYSRSFDKLGQKDKVTKKDLKEAGIYKDMLGAKEKDYPGVEATYFKNIRPVRHEFKADKRAWNMYKLLHKASNEADKLAYQLSKEADDVAKKLRLSRKDFVAIREFREGTPEAPTRLTENQAKFNRWLTKKLGEKPGEGLHGLFKVKGFVKSYISRRLDRDLLSMEEILYNRLTDLTDDKRALPVIKKWFDMKRTGYLQRAKKNALDIYKEYVRAGAKALYFDELLKKFRKEDLKKLQPGMKEAMNNYINRLLGYPTTQAYEFNELLNRGLHLAGIKKEIRFEDTLRLAQFLTDFAYVRHLGLRPKSMAKNLIQTINNTCPELGYFWTARGFGSLLHKGFKEADEAGILLEFAPVMFKEFEKGSYKNYWDAIKDSSLLLFQLSDQVNRCIAYYGSLDKFDYFLRGYQKHKNIPKFLKWLEVNKMHIRYQEDIIEALEKGDITEARKIYAEKITGDTQYLYTKQDSPLITSHPGGRMLYQYASWPINYSELLVDDVKQRHWQAIVRRLVLYASIGYAIKKGVVSEKGVWKKATGLGPFQYKRQRDIIPPAVSPLADWVDTIVLPFLRGDLTKRKWEKFGKKVTPLVIQDIQKARKKGRLEELIK